MKNERRHESFCRALVGSGNRLQPIGQVRVLDGKGGTAASGDVGEGRALSRCGIDGPKDSKRIKTLFRMIGTGWCPAPEPHFSRNGFRFTRLGFLAILASRTCSPIHFFSFPDVSRSRQTHIPLSCKKPNSHPRSLFFAVWMTRRRTLPLDTPRVSMGRFRLNLEPHPKVSCLGGRQACAPRRRGSH